MYQLFPLTIDYKGKTFNCSYTMVDGWRIYKATSDVNKLYTMINSGDYLYQIYVKAGIKLVRKSDNFIVKTWFIS